MLPYEFERVDFSQDPDFQNVGMEALATVFEEFDSLRTTLEVERLQLRPFAAGQWHQIRGGLRPVWIHGEDEGDNTGGRRNRKLNRRGELKDESESWDV